MKNIHHIIQNLIIALTLMMAFGLKAEAQNENKFIRRGNNAYADQDFKKAEIDYRKALDKNQSSAKGEFNLGTSLYQQEGYEESAKIYEKLAGRLQTPEAKAGAYHNLGNSLVQSQQYQPAIDAFKNALRINPNDADSKYNLEYARQMLQQQQQQKQDQHQDQQNDQDKKDDQQKQDQENDQDKQNDQQQQEQEQKDQQQDQQQQNQSDQQQPQGQQQPKQISKEDAERMLQALKDNEKNTLEKLKLEKLKSAKRVKSDKDW